MSTPIEKQFSYTFIDSTDSVLYKNLWKKRVAKAIFYGIVLFSLSTLGALLNTQCFYDTFKDKSMRSNGFDASDIHVASDYNCTEEPLIPYKGESYFEFDQAIFPRLSIQQRTNSTIRKNQHHFVRGKTRLIWNPRLLYPTVDFDLKFSNEELQDSFSIEKNEYPEDGVLSLLIKGDQSVLAEGCIKLDVSINIPGIDSLKRLDIGTIFSDVIFMNDMICKEGVDIKTVKGDIGFEATISVGKSVLSSVNGDIKGNIEVLTDDIDMGTAKGDIVVTINTIDQGDKEAIKIKSNVVKGLSQILVPESFESQYELTSVKGKRYIDASLPEKIHQKSKGWFTTKGYFGNNEETKNKVELHGVNSDINLYYF
ncbi:uncharacterized protein B0P05DRAFT_555055 [Gilbertella persicaria]|uniref:uncharacterized protein n=1 Tax=Gilbertella persicaria TaxID=101096 RepID=UPI00222074D3|nr:uncharacterized protein B0P05DRAFT_555055 [Gilbertella persicaria]KAI8064335.1 hypothetical protein B0P05DRAFT_555055 [Gilbertella persicaria]